MHIYIYAYTHTHTYVYSYICIYTYIHTIYTYIDIHIHTYMYTYICIYMHTYIYIYIILFNKAHFWYKERLWKKLLASTLSVREDSAVNNSGDKDGACSRHAIKIKSLPCWFHYTECHSALHWAGSAKYCWSGCQGAMLRWQAGRQAGRLAGRQAGLRSVQPLSSQGRNR